MGRPRPSLTRSGWFIPLLALLGVNLLGNGLAGIAGGATWEDRPGRDG